MIKWGATKDEHNTIMQIVKRAYDHSPTFASMGMSMDIEATHCNGCKLKLDELADAPISDLIHDVMGIEKNLNRETGKLENCFFPRYAV